ncbi:MAG: hypothetical protein K2X38_04330 [Gemmataceae bacterium]|nr:hypothetical protein [Gemmataceae bacterium]
MIRRIILELRDDMPLSRAQQEATELAAVKQTNVYFQHGPAWYRTIFTPAQSAVVRCEKIEGTPMPICDMPPTPNSPTTH